jgi:hypothetical protein
LASKPPRPLAPALIASDQHFQIELCFQQVIGRDVIYKWEICHAILRWSAGPELAGELARRSSAIDAPKRRAKLIAPPPGGGG